MITEKERKQFASRYDEQVQELLVLTSESVGNAGSWGRKRTVEAICRAASLD